MSIPEDLYRRFIEHHGHTLNHPERQRLLRRGRLFGEGLSRELRNALGERMREKPLAQGEFLRRTGKPRIVTVEQGRLELQHGEEIITELHPGDALSEALLGRGERLRAAEGSTLLTLPVQEVEGIPVIHWKLREIHAPWIFAC